jgi:glutathione S-transferase
VELVADEIDRVWGRRRPRSSSRYDSRVGVPRLITIAFSHFCEKARWALDHGRIEYTEEAHAPIFSSVAAKRAGGTRQVPVLVVDGEAIPSSTEIARWVDEQPGVEPLFPDGDLDVVAWDDELVRRFGPATRRVGYFHALQTSDRDLASMLLGPTIPGYQRALGRFGARAIAVLIRRGLRVDAAGAERSTRIVDDIFARVAATLADGRRYLTGDAFTAADLAFAALATPVIWPDAYAATAVPLERLTPSLRDIIAVRRAEPAGEFALRLYDEHRSSDHTDRHRGA